MPDTDLVETRWIVDDVPSKRWPVYTRGNVGEVFPDAISPLGWTFLGDYTESGWRDAYKRLGAFADRDFDDGPRVFSGVFNGYAYLNASILRVLGVRSPGLTAEAVDMQLLGDSSAPPYDEQKGDRNVWLTMKTTKTTLAVLRGEGLPQPAIDSRRLAAAALAAAPPLATATNDELVAYAESMQSTHAALFSNHLFVTGGSQVAAGFLAWLCIRAGEPGLQLDLTTDLGDVESAAPGLALWDLGRIARANSAVTAAFDAGVKGLWARLQNDPSATEFVASFRAFLVEHGHRGPNEWEIMSPTWRIEPDIALAAVERMRLADETHAPSSQRDKARAIREAAEIEILDNLDWNDRRRYAKVRRATARYAQGREATKNQCIIVLNAVRETMVELNQRTIARGGVEDFRHASMLSWTEFKEYLVEPASKLSLIDQRWAYHQRLVAIDPPYVVVGTPPSLASIEAEVATELGFVPVGTELQGAGGSPGIVQGRARVILEPWETNGIEPGDILIAPITDPSWTPLFLAAGGVVVDVGAAQSHAVVVSRELCIPCVVSVKRATKIIPDGAWVEVDGSAGTVKILRLADAPVPV